MIAGLATFVRRLLSRHGDAKDFATRYAATGLRWCLLAGPWHDARGPRLVNAEEKCRAYADALARCNVTPVVWGYPWQGSERLWCDQMRSCAGDHVWACVDAERGANPSRRSTPQSLARARSHAQALLEGLARRGFESIYVCTYGAALRMRWFPAEAFVRNLAALRNDGDLRWAGFGGQAYVDDERVEPIISEFSSALRRFDASDLVALVPAGGLYKFVGDKHASRRKSAPKTPKELRRHLTRFMGGARRRGDREINAVALWAENFLGQHGSPLWVELCRLNDWMFNNMCR